MKLNYFNLFELTHLFFVDDVLIFARASAGQMRLIIDVLSSFCNALGLRGLKLELSQLSTVKFASNLGKYLGLPLVQGRVKRTYFNFIIDRI